MAVHVAHPEAAVHGLGVHPSDAARSKGLRDLLDSLLPELIELPDPDCAFHISLSPPKMFAQHTLGGAGRQCVSGFGSGGSAPRGRPAPPGAASGAARPPL